MQRWHLQQATQTLDAGGIIAYPTEAVYGLGCDPLQESAVLRLCAIKQRPLEKGLILIAADFKQLKPFIARLDKKLKRKIKKSWPGPVTWLLPAHPDIPLWLCGAHSTIAVRVTAHPVASALCRAFGSALVSTSANVSLQPPARTPLKVRQIFSERIDMIVHGATGTLKRPTEIRDGNTGKIIRPGS